MSTTLAMVLAAGLAAGSGPEKVSGEVVFRLDLRGQWEGWWYGGSGRPLEVTLGEGIILYERDNGVIIPVRFLVVDNGNGKLRFGRGRKRGTYRQYGDHLIMTYEFDRPDGSDEQTKRLLILHRVRTPAR